MLTSDYKFKCHFLYFKQFTKPPNSWISIVSRMSYGVTNVRSPSRIYIVTFAMLIYVKLVLGNIFVMNLKNTKLCRSNSAALLFDVHDIPPKYVNYTANNVVFQFV